MQAVLLDLAAKSPFPLSGVRVVECGSRHRHQFEVADLKPSRRDVILGIEWPDGVEPEEESRKKRIKRLIDDALDDAA
jgi:hypothetical protein